MENLFVENINFEKTANTTWLSKDSSKWVKEIINAFLGKFPFLQEETILVDWKKKNEDKGYGVGVIKVLGGVVPIIVQDFNLSPLDVLIHDGNYIPLNDETLRIMMESPDAFGGVAASAPKSNNQLFEPHLSNTSFSPTNTGRAGGPGDYMEIRPAKTASSTLDQISSVDLDRAREIVKYINDNPSVKHAFERNENVDVVEKLAKKTHTSSGSALKNYLRNLDIDRQYVYSDDLGNHYLKQANSTLDKSWTTRISEDEALEYGILASRDKGPQVEGQKLASFDLVDSPGEVINFDSDGNWEIKSAEYDRPSDVIDLPYTESPSKGDYVSILSEDGATKPYEVISVEKTAEETISAKKLHKSPEKAIFFDQSGDYCIKEADLAEKADQFVSETNYIPKLGQYGVIVSGDYASEPFEVTSMQKTANMPSWEIKGFTGLEKIGFEVVKTEVEGGFEPHEELQNRFYISKDASFVPLNKENNKLAEKMEKKAYQSGVLKISMTDGLNTIDLFYDNENEGAGLEKQAGGAWKAGKNIKLIKSSRKESNFEKSAELETNQHYVGRDNAGFYYLKGREFDKYASHGHDVRDLSQDEAAWAVIHCGGTIGDLKKVANLKNSQIQPLRGQIDAPRSLNDTRDKIKQDKYASKIPTFDFNLIKEAAVLTDKASVDAVLSLGLMQKHNIEEYLEVIPTYEAVMSELAKLLLTARLGLSQLPPEPVKRAMDALTEVTIMLKAIRSTLKDVK